MCRVVTGVNGQVASVRLPDHGRTISVHAMYLRPLQPELNSKVQHTVKVVQDRYLVLMWVTGESSQWRRAWRHWQPSVN